MRLVIYDRYGYKVKQFNTRCNPNSVDHRVFTGLVSVLEDVDQWALAERIARAMKLDDREFATELRKHKRSCG